MTSMASLELRAPVLTLREVSCYLRVHPSTIYKLLRAKRLPAFKIGSDWRFNLEAIDHWRIEMQRGEESARALEAERTRTR
jgi:excisionase family DNA binding protein